MEVDPLVPELMSRIENGVRANLKNGAGTREIIDIRSARDDTGAKRMVNFRDITIASSTDIDRFGVKSIDLITGPIDIK